MIDWVILDLEDDIIQKSKMSIIPVDLAYLVISGWP